MATNPSPQPNTIQLAATPPQILPDPGVALITYDKPSGLLKAVDSTGASIFPSSGGGTPGGADKQIQFNDAGAFAGDAAMVFDKTAQTIFFGPTGATSSFECNPSDGTGEADFALQGSGVATLEVDDGSHASNLQMTSQHVNITNNDPTGQVELQASNQVVLLAAKLGFFSTSTGVTKPAVTGSNVAGEAAASLIAGLAALGLVTDSTTPATRPFDVGVFNPGLGSNAQKLLVLNIQRAVTFPAGAANSKFTGGTAATGSTTFTFKKNGSSFATAVFSASGTLAAFTQASDAVFAVGDQLEIDGPATADATLADFTCTLSGHYT